MKKLILPILLILSVCTFAQKQPVQKDSIQYRDSFPPIPDSVYFINQLQIGEVYKYVMDNMSATEFSKVSQGMEVAFRVLTQMAEDQYNKKRKHTKVPVRTFQVEH
jgi:hypothetical protein